MLSLPRGWGWESLKLKQTVLGKNKYLRSTKNITTI